VNPEPEVSLLVYGVCDRGAFGAGDRAALPEDVAFR